MVSHAVPEARSFRPWSNLLQRLSHLDRSSSLLHSELSNILYGEEYKQCVGDLQNDDLLWLVDYLDQVRFFVALLGLYLSQRRLSMFSILMVLLFGNVYANSEKYVVPGLYYRPHTSFRLHSSTSVLTLLPPEVSPTSIKGPSLNQRFASNVLGYTPWMVQKKP